MVLFCMVFRSLSRGTEWSPDLKIISNIASLVLGIQLEVVLLALLSLGLDIDILEVIPIEGLTFFFIKRIILSFF